MINVNNDPLEWFEGMTVRDAIRARKYTFPRIAVWINDKPIAREDFDTAVIPDEANVQIIHMISGG